MALETPASTEAVRRSFSVQRPVQCQSWKIRVLTLTPPTLSIHPASVPTTNRDTPGSGALIKHHDPQDPGAMTVSVVNLIFQKRLRMSILLGIILISPNEVGRAARGGDTTSSLQSWTIKRRKQSEQSPACPHPLLSAALLPAQGGQLLLLLQLLLQQRTVPEL